MTAPRLRWAQRALALAPVAVWAVTAWRARWVCDDAFIDFRVAQSLLAGDGLVFNRGERVEAFTNPLWVLLLALARAVVAGDDGEVFPWLAVAMGLALSLAGLAVPTLAALRRSEPSRATELALPLGALVVMGLAPFADFATSGLETGLSLFWLGLSWTLCDPRRAARDAPLARQLGACALVGLGPLIRPDLAVFALALVALRVATDPARTHRRVALGLVAAGAAPVAWEVFRMGYYAALVSNSAIAKEASLPYWSQGVSYLADFTRPYRIAAPLLALLSALALAARRSLALLALPAAAVAHALFVARVGGDFMHARLLLPTVFALCLPVLVVEGRARWALVVAAPWALVALTSLRAPTAAPDARVIDERAYYARATGVARPITLADHAQTLAYRAGVALRREATRGRAIHVVGTITPDGRALAPVSVDALRDDVPARVVAANLREVGVFAMAAGLDVRVHDVHGLADPIAARARLTRRARPGHEKHIPPSWSLARYLPVGVRPELDAQPALVAARRALGCDGLRELDAAIHAPLTLRRALRNAALAPSLTALRFSHEPAAAARRLCGSAP